MALIGSLSTNEFAEKAVKNGHPTTEARQNDLTQVLLGLFIPWDRLRIRLGIHAVNLSNTHLY